MFEGAPEDKLELNSVGSASRNILPKTISRAFGSSSVSPPSSEQLTGRCCTETHKLRHEKDVWMQHTICRTQRQVFHFYLGPRLVPPGCVHVSLPDYVFRVWCAASHDSVS